MGSKRVERRLGWVVAGSGAVGCSGRGTRFLRGAGARGGIAIGEEVV